MTLEMSSRGPVRRSRSRIAKKVSRRKVKIDRRSRHGVSKKVCRRARVPRLSPKITISLDGGATKDWIKPLAVASGLGVIGYAYNDYRNYLHAQHMAKTDQEMQKIQARIEKIGKLDDAKEARRVEEERKCKQIRDREEEDGRGCKHYATQSECITKNTRLGHACVWETDGGVEPNSPRCVSTCGRSTAKKNER